MNSEREMRLDVEKNIMSKYEQVAEKEKQSKPARKSENKI